MYSSDFKQRSFVTFS